LFILLLVLYALFLNPRCWPKHQVPGVRYQVSGLREQVTGYREQVPVAILRLQANPYTAPQFKLIALKGKDSWPIGNRQSKIESGKSPLFPIPYSLFPSSPPQTAGPHNADQVLLQVYDALNGALKGNATLGGGNTNPTPHNADQVFLAVYDPVNGAIRINITAQSLQAVLGGPNEVPFSATPTFNLAQGNVQEITLSGLLAPAAATLSQVSGGSISATTYYVELTYLNSSGQQTTGSTEARLAVDANHLLQVSSPAASGSGGGAAVSYNVAVSTVTGTETIQNSTPIAIGTNWSEPTSGLVAGTALPGGNNTGNVTSSTLTGAAVGPIYFIVHQDAIGGHTFVPPSNVLGWTAIGSTASKANAQSFVFNGTNAYALGPGSTNM
jgi:hypothetical protein